MGHTERFYHSSVSNNLFLHWLLSAMLSWRFLVHLIMVTTRDVEEQMPPPVQLGEISEEELKQYDGSVQIRCQSSSDLSQQLFCVLGVQEIEAFLMMPFQKETKVEAFVMEEGDSPVRRWEDLDTDILVKIFQSFDLFERISVITPVCHTWLLASSDQLLWKMLDLSVLQSNFIRTLIEPYVYVDSPSDQKLTRLLEICLNLSCGNILTLIFHYNLYVNDNQLTYTAERCPRLRRLVMPAWNKITRTEICRAIHIWEDLESLTMPSIRAPASVIEEIARSCRNFAELKIMGPCDMLFASALVSFLPNLKVLSVRCTVLSKPALVIILEGLKELKVLNISHCVITEDPPPAPMKILTKLDESILEKASRLRKFVTCMSDSCITCQRTRHDEGEMRWYRYGDLWKVDEVKSLEI